VPNDPPAAAPAPAPPPLSREGIREVQKRLAGFGFDPGPIDGVAGRRTEEATQRYLETRGQPQMPPNDPQMLEQLRQDTAPPVAPTQVAQRANGSGTRTAQGGATQPARRQFDPFEPVKVAGTEITRFLQSVFR
jgi:peptidoglycan hydrolase-like protein with peptidoglycan-binding domain